MEIFQVLMETFLQVCLMAYGVIGRTCNDHSRRDKDVEDYDGDYDTVNEVNEDDFAIRESCEEVGKYYEHGKDDPESKEEDGVDCNAGNDVKNDYDAGCKPDGKDDNSDQERSACVDDPGDEGDNNREDNKNNGDGSDDDNEIRNVFTEVPRKMAKSTVGKRQMLGKWGVVRKGKAPRQTTKLDKANASHLWEFIGKCCRLNTWKMAMSTVGQRQMFERWEVGLSLMGIPKRVTLHNRNKT